jgi:hypothetical protein
VRKTVPALAILVGLGTTTAANAELPLELDWDAPKECPKSSYVLRRVEQILQRDSRDSSAAVGNGEHPARAGVNATAKVARAGGRRYEMALTVRSGGFEETKTISTSSCGGLAEAAAVIVSLAIRSSDGTAPSSEPPPPAPSDPAPLSPTSPPPTIEPARSEGPAASLSPAPSPSSRTSIPQDASGDSPTPKDTTLAIDLGGSIVSGVLPSAAPGLDATVALRVARLRAGLLGTLSFRRTSAFGETARASFDMVGAGAFIGYLLPIGVFALGPSADLEATFVRAEGHGIRTPFSSTAVWPSASVGARAEMRLTRRFGAFARTDLVFPLGAPRFTLVTAGDAVVVHEPALVAPRLSLGIEIVVP